MVKPRLLPGPLRWPVRYAVETLHCRDAALVQRALNTQKYFTPPRPQQTPRTRHREAARRSGRSRRHLRSEHTAVSQRSPSGACWGASTAVGSGKGASAQVPSLDVSAWTTLSKEVSSRRSMQDPSMAAGDCQPRLGRRPAPVRQPTARSVPRRGVINGCVTLKGSLSLKARLVAQTAEK